MYRHFGLLSLTGTHNVMFLRTARTFLIEQEHYYDPSQHSGCQGRQYIEVLINSFLRGKGLRCKYQIKYSNYRCKSHSIYKDHLLSD